MTSENKALEFHRFKTVFNKAIQRHAPMKKRNSQANQAPFINRKINKEIMKRSHLRTTLSKYRVALMERHIISSVISV